MKEETRQLIKEIAKFIEKDRYHPLLTLQNYDKYLEGVLTKLVEGSIRIEVEE